MWEEEESVVVGVVAESGGRAACCRARVGRAGGRRLLDGTRVRRWSSGLGAGATDKHAGLES